MKVLVASAIVPFIRGGGRAIVDDLTAALRGRGHEVDHVLMPVVARSADLPEQLLALRLLDVSHEGDVLIAIRTPSYALRHPNKVVWFIHHHRVAYDLWGTQYQDLPGDGAGLLAREPIIRADDVYLREARRIFTNSQVVSDRLRRFNRLDSRVLYPPLGNTTGLRAESYDDFIFYPSRLAPIKRQELLVEAMAHVRSQVRLVLAGAPDEPGQLRRLQSRIDELGLRERVDLRGHWIAEEEKRHLFAHALASAYVAYDEDSYGYSTLESFHAAKAVITCTDSGGTHELVEDGVTGLIAEPTPQALAQAMDSLMDDRDRAISLGQTAHRRLDELDISWDNVVRKLLA